MYDRRVRTPVFVLFTLPLVLGACGPEEPTASDAMACPITAPTRLFAAPDSFEPTTEDAWYGLYRFGDEILFTFDRFDDPAREYWRLNRCTGEAQPYAPLAPGLHHPYVVDTLGGQILYGADDVGRPYVVDRFDDPGDDTPRPVLGLPDILTYIAYSKPGTAKFFEFWTSGTYLGGAAGMDALTYAIYAHSGDPDVPAVLLSDRLIAASGLDDTHSIAHEESGEISRIDDLTGEREVLVTGARHMDYSFDGRTFIWQEMGDDMTEPVYLHDIETGEDLQIAVNEFAALSWRRDEDSEDSGEWIYARSQDPVAAAMIGPGNRYVSAVRIDTGDPLEIPSHIEQRGTFGGYFRLLLANDGEYVEALWDPRTGSVRESYRGSNDRPYVTFVDGDVAEYFERSDDVPFTGSLRRTNLDTGESVQILREVGWSPRRLDDRHYLVEEPQERIEGPDTEVTGYILRELVDLVLADTVSDTSTPIAESISNYSLVPDEGIVYIDMLGPQPGLWAYPLPHEAARAAALSDVPRHTITVHLPASRDQPGSRSELVETPPEWARAIELSRAPRVAN